MTTAPTPADVHRRVSVTDGRRTLGSVLERGDVYEAVSIEGHSVGLFSNEARAATELWKWAVQSGGSPPPFSRILRTARGSEWQRQITDLLREEFDAVAREVAAERGGSDA